MALLYGGPDQIMGVASGIATIVGMAMVFWNKVCVTFGKIMNKVKPESPVQEPKAPQDGV